MKILMLTPYVPYPPSSGGQIRTFNLLKYLSQKHDITLVALYKNDTEKKYLSHLKQYCKKIYLCRRPKKPWQFNNIFKAIFSSQPFLVVRNYSKEAKEIVDQLLKKQRFDVIHAETFYIMPHISYTKIPIVLVEQTIEYKVYQHFINTLPCIIRFILTFDILKLKYRERFFWRKANIVAAVSESDETMIKQLEPHIKTTIVPNGAGDEMIAQKLTPKDLREPIIFFQGNFNWLQNVEAAKYLIQSIYPNLIKLLPSMKLIISGQNAHKIKLSGQKNISIVDIDPGDSTTVLELFKKATLFIAPIFGPGGTRLKILAAMGSGIPVISTKTGVEGLAVENNKHVILAETSEDFSIKIAEILSSKNKYESIRLNAYMLVKEQYNWKKIAQKLETVYQDL